MACRHVGLMLIGIGVLSSTIMAETLSVPSGYPTIQAAIDAASDGDVILVDDGTYAGPGNRNLSLTGKTLTIRSVHTPENCIIDCQKKGRAFCLIETGENPVVIEGFTIINGRSICDMDIDESGYGGAIYSYESAVTIRHCIIRNNTAEDEGGAIYIDEADLTVEDCVIDHNQAYNAGGISGWYCSAAFNRCDISHNIGGGVVLDGDDDSASMNQCTITANVPIKEDGEEDYGGGLYFEGGTLTMEDCRVINNRCYYEGGGIFCSGDLLILRRCMIQNNTIDWSGGGVYCGEAQIFESTITGNVAGEDGGGIYSEETLILKDCIVKSNRSGEYNCYYGCGGGVYCWDAEITGCEISGNLAECAGNGAGIYADGELVLRDCTVNNNTCLADEYDDAGNGGGISCWQAEITRCQICDNSVKGIYGYGGGIICVDASILDCTINNNQVGPEGEGAGVHCNYTTLSNCTISNNKAGSEGSGAGVNCSDTIIKDCQITDNRLGKEGYGAGISSYDTLAVLNCRICGNAIDGQGSGGGIDCYGDGSLANCIFSGNSAGEEGWGGAVIAWGHTVTMTNCTVVGNEAQAYGGGICMEGGKMEMSNSIVWQNQAHLGPQLALRTYNRLTASTPPEESYYENLEPIIMDPNLMVTGDIVIVDCQAADVGDIAGDWEELTNFLNTDDYVDANTICLETTPDCASVNVSYSTVQGGQENVYVDPGCILEWSEGNQNSYPAFVQPGYWKGNRWIEGDYRLCSGSSCINTGNTSVAEQVEARVNRQPETAYGIAITPEIIADPNHQSYFQDMAVSIPLGGGFCLFAAVEDSLQACSSLEISPLVYEVSYQSADNAMITETTDKDIEGTDRVLGGSVDRGAVEYQGNEADFIEEPENQDELTIVRMTVRVGQPDGLGSFVVEGRFGDDYRLEQRQAFMEQAERVFVGIGPFSQEISTGDFKAAYQSMIYTFRKNNSAGITLLQMNFKKGTFRIAGKHAYLAGVECPVGIEITLGDYRCLGQASAECVNQGKPIPMALSMSYEDRLRIDKASVKVGKQANTDVLSVEGALAVHDTSVDLTEQEVVFDWAGQQFTIGAGLLEEKRPDVYIGKLIDVEEGGVATMEINLQQGRFKATFMKTQVDTQTGQIETGLVFGDYVQTTVFELP